jgi:FdrA protein
VAYLLGTEADPQVYSRQREVLEQAGCLVPETNARAAYTAAALVLRRPEVCEAGR